MKNQIISKITKIISITLVVVLFAFYAYSYYNNSVILKQTEENLAIKSLIQSLKEGDMNAQADALKAMAEMGESAVQPLISALEDESVKFRRKAADALINIGDPAVEPLIEALDDNHQKIRRSAAFALEKGDPNWASSDAAINYIPSLIASLNSTDTTLRDDTVNMLSKIGEPAVQPLLAILTDNNWHVRESAVSALGKIKAPQSVKALVNMLDDDHWQVRRTAAYVLGKMDSSLAIIPLREALKDKSTDVKTAANKSLKRLALIVSEPVEEE